MKIPILHEYEAVLRVRLQHFIGRRLMKRSFLSRSFCRGLGAKGALIVGDFSDHRLAFRPGDNIGDHLFYEGQWQRKEIERALAFAMSNRPFPHAAVFVDVGANNGTHTVYSMLSGYFARAVAVEPEPENFRLLRLNIFLNELESKVTAYPKAAGAIAGTATLSLSGSDNSGGHTLLAMQGAAGSITVEVARLDDIIADTKTDPRDLGMVWIDAEGFEPQIINGAPRIVAAGVPICMEFNVQRYEPGMTAALIADLADRYRSWIALHDDNPQPQPITALTNVTAMTDIMVF